MRSFLLLLTLLLLPDIALADGPCYLTSSITACFKPVGVGSGGTGVVSTATFPTSGVVVTEAAVETLSNKTLTTPFMTSPVVGTSSAANLSQAATFFEMSGNPAASPGGGGLALFAETDDFLYQKNSAGTQRQICTVSSTQTLTNKTLTLPKIDQIIVPGIFNIDFTAVNTDWAFPSSTPDPTNFVGDATTQTLTHKTLTGNTAANLISGSGTLTLNTTGTITVPSATDTLVGKATTDTLTNKTLTSPAITTPTGIVKGDVGLGNVDNTSDATKNAASVTLTNKTLTTPVIASITSSTGTFTHNTSGTVTVPNATDTLVGKATTDVLTNKTLTGNTAVNLVSGSGTLTLNTTGTMTLPNATDTVVGKATTDTLTNKTLTGNLAANLINSTGQLNLNSSGTITVPSATDTLVGKATTDTFTNKTFDAAGTGNSLSNVVNANVGSSAAIAGSKISPIFATHVDVSGAATLTSTASCSGSLVDLYTVNTSSELASAGDCVQYKVVANHGNAAEATAYVNACRAGSTIYGISLGVYAQASGSGAIAVTGNGTGTAKIQYASVGCGTSYVELIGKTIN